MLYRTGKNRSPFCHIITDFHSARQNRLARFDPWGVSLSALLAALLVESVRIMVSH
jgi:hypothetical protein